MRRRTLLVASWTLAMWPAAHARAHAMPHSVVLVESKAGAVRITASIPFSELIVVLGETPRDEVELRAQLTQYLNDHAAIVGEDGSPWISVFEDAAWAHRGPGEHAVARASLHFKPPEGASDRAAILRYDAVTHRVASHYALVYRWLNGEMAPLGRLQLPETTLVLP